jgi:sugar phosphate isomerase/epimerase
MHLGCIPQLNVPFPELVDQVAALGLRHVCVGQRAFGDLTAGQVRAECRRAGVALSAMWAWQGVIKPGMTDPAEIEQGLAKLEETLRFAQEVGCPVLCTGGGHPGGYTVNLENRRPGLTEEVIACWERAAPLLEMYGIYLSFETGIHTTVYHPDQYREIFHRIGCKYVSLNMDVVNMLSAEDYYDQHPKIDALFDRARGYVTSAHLKDIVHEKKLHTHLNEAAPGEGNLDWEYVFDHLNRALPSWGAGFIEATPWETMPTAVEFLRSKAKAVGMPID